MDKLIRLASLLAGNIHQLPILQLIIKDIYQPLIMNSSRPSKNNIVYKSRPASSDKNSFSTILPSLSKKDFNRQNEVYNNLCGNIFPVSSEVMKQTMHSCIIPLIFIHPGTQKYNSGTAFLIASNIAITSAHNIYDKNFNKYHWDIQLRPSLAGISKEDYEIQSYFLPDQFIAETEPKRSTLHDYAFIKLKKPVDLQSYLMLTINFNSYKEMLAIYGYPGARYQKVDEKVTIQQYGLQRQDDINEDYEDKQLKRLRYNISTQEGQSGCPVIVGRGERNKVIAIHKGGNKQKQFNYGRLITKDIIFKLQKWRKQHKGEEFKCFDFSTNTNFDFREEEVYASEQVFQESQIVEIIRPSLFQTRPLTKEKKKKGDSLKKEEQNSVFTESNLFKHINFLICQLVQPPKDREKPNPREIRREGGRRDLYDYFKKPSFWNQQAKNSLQFTISNKIVTKKYNNGMFQITSLKPIQHESKIIFIVHSYSKTIILGLTKASNINLPYSGGQNMKGSIALSTDNQKKRGKIIINGEIKVEKGYFIKPEDCLTVEVSIKHWFIFFNTKTKNYCKTLDEQFCKGEWYIFASLKQEGDRVEVIL